MSAEPDGIILLPADEANAEGWVESLRHLMTFDESDAGLQLVEAPPSPSTSSAPTAHSLRDLVWRANHDSLTMLSNRSWFLRCAESSRQALENRGHDHLLMVLDLDRFKQINDTRGHGAGDAVLAEIGQRLRDITRPGDTVGRLGGDEFAIWVERVEASMAANLARRYLSIFDEPVAFDEIELDVAGSIGVVATDGTRPVAEALDHADAALYDAKARGPKAFCIFDRTLQARMAEASTRKREIADAVLHDEFDFDVQPIVDLRSDMPIGYEVLARWNHPRRGRLYPGEFLPYVESTNLTHAFDAMIIEKAAAAFNSWRYSLRAPQSIWVNMSPTQLEASFPELVEAILDRYGLRPGELVFELTEHDTANTPGRIAVLNSLRSLGVQIAIDDFGTGYSQLSYLQDLPIDFVKLDRSFVSGFHADPKRAAITESIIRLAQALGAKIIAEGVERPRELELLRELGCDCAQGHLLAPPGAPAELLGH